MFDKMKLSHLRTLYKDTKGGALVYTAVTLPALIGFTGLAVDVSLWHVMKRETQTMADAGAISAAQDVIRFGNMLDIDGAALDGAVLNGFVTSTDNIAVNNPPLQGTLVGDPEGIEVVVDVPASGFFTPVLSIFGDVDFNAGNRVRSRAVVRVVTRPGDACIMTLDPARDGSLTVQGNSTTILGCGTVVNSTDESAYQVNGDPSCYIATSITISGGIGGEDIHDPDLDTECRGVYPEPTTGFTQLHDPLSGLEELDDSGGCDISNKVIVNDGQSIVFEAVTAFPDFPDVAIFNFCKGLEVRNGSNATLSFDPANFVAAIFLISDGRLKITGGSLTGGDLMIYLGAESEGVDITGGIVTLSAAGLEDPDGDDWDGRLDGYPYNGILFFEDPDFVDNGQERVNKLNGGSGLSLEGVSYFPDSTLEFNGGSGAWGASFIANNINISGNSTLGTLESVILQQLLEVKFVQLVE